MHTVMHREDIQKSMCLSIEIMRKKKNKVIGRGIFDRTNEAAQWSRQNWRTISTPIDIYYKKRAIHIENIYIYCRSFDGGSKKFTYAHTHIYIHIQFYLQYHHLYIYVCTSDKSSSSSSSVEYLSVYINCGNRPSIL